MNRESWHAAVRGVAESGTLEKQAGCPKQCCCIVSPTLFLALVWSRMTVFRSQCGAP